MLRRSKILALLIVVGAIGCGKTNPAEDYKNLPTVAREQASGGTPDQKYWPSAGSIDIVGPDKIGHFVEGKQGQVTLQYNPFPGITEGTLTIPTLPSWLNVTQTGTNTWMLWGTPKVGTVLPDVGALNLEIEAVVRPTKVANDFLLKLGTDETLEMSVLKTDEIPVIDVSNWKDDINEGDSFNFSVLVKDVAGGNSPPTVSFSNCDKSFNKEFYKLLLQPLSLVQPGNKDSLVQIAGGWQGEWAFDATYIPLKRLPDPNVNEVLGCIAINAGSSTRNSAQPILKWTKIHLKDESPDISVSFQSTNSDGTLANSGIAPNQRDKIYLTPGALSTIHISGAIFNGRGAAKLVVANEKAVEAWEGAPTFKVSGDPSNANNLAVQNLDMTWQVPCKPKAGNYSLNLQSVNTQVAVNGKLKGINTSRNISFNAAGASCAQPPAPAPLPAAAPENPAPAQRGAPSKAGGVTLWPARPLGMGAVQGDLVTKAPTVGSSGNPKATVKFKVTPKESAQPPAEQAEILKKNGGFALGKMSGFSDTKIAASQIADAKASSPQTSDPKSDVKPDQKASKTTATAPNNPRRPVRKLPPREGHKPATPPAAPSSTVPPTVPPTSPPVTPEKTQTPPQGGQQ